MLLSGAGVLVVLLSGAAVVLVLVLLSGPSTCRRSTSYSSEVLSEVPVSCESWRMMSAASRSARLEAISVRLPAVGVRVVRLGAAERPGVIELAA